MKIEKICEAHSSNSLWSVMKTERLSREYQPLAVCVLTESMYRI